MATTSCAFQFSWRGRCCMLLLACGAVVQLAHRVAGQESPGPDKLPSMKLEDFRPRPALVTTDSTPERARFPVVDIHTHFRYKLKGSEDALEDYVQLMDRNQIAACCSLDGRLGDQWSDHERLSPDRSIDERLHCVTQAVAD